MTITLCDDPTLGLVCLLLNITFNTTKGIIAFIYFQWTFRYRLAIFPFSPLFLEMLPKYFISFMGKISNKKGIMPFIY